MTDHTYVLRFRVAELDPEDRSTAPALNEGRADVILSTIDDQGFVEFIVPAPSIARAITYALTELARKAPHLRVCELEREFVGATEIADRLGVSRETVRLWATGQRNANGFPSPAHYVGNQRVWDWAEVQAWAREHDHTGESEHHPDADTAAIANGALAECRRNPSLRPHLLVKHRLESRGGPRGDSPPHTVIVGATAQDVAFNSRVFNGWDLGSLSTNAACGSPAPETAKRRDSKPTA
jgi:predicted DNA-binding transcriptional regulator AlpA